MRMFFGFRGLMVMTVLTGFVWALLPGDADAQKKHGGRDGESWTHGKLQSSTSP